ncbi:acetyl-CoA carboxylase biotin carboxylase subunit family protein [Mesorhizobium sp. M0006]|uniref:ATP-grasp domain-containing protein n=1 Tax=Mesorhizobium sp. M0006 TaxID=2956838 RepID=UPI0033397034
MGKRALILIEGHSRGNGLRYIRGAERLGLYPITLAADPGQYDYLAAEGTKAIRAETESLDRLIEACSQLRATYEIVGITGFSGGDESVYATVGKLCQHFGLPGPDPTSVERCADKFVQRELLLAAGIPVPAYRLARNEAEVKRAAAEMGFPVIVKPAVGSGSIGVRLCRNAGELVHHFRRMLSESNCTTPRILIEEFVQGPFYSVEIMADEIIGVVAVEFGPEPHFVFRQTTFPAPVTDREYAKISDVSLSCLRSLGLGWGPSNIELRWTNRGPVVIEVNPRLAGALEPQLVHLAYGVDLVIEHIKLLIGAESDLRRRHSHTAAARFLLPDLDGTLEWIDGDSQAAAVPGVVEVKLDVEPKAIIMRKGDYRDTIGHIIAASPSRARTEDILQRAVDLIKWSVASSPKAGATVNSATHCHETTMNNRNPSDGPHDTKVGFSLHERATELASRPRKEDRTE